MIARSGGVYTEVTESGGSSLRESELCTGRVSNCSPPSSAVSSIMVSSCFTSGLEQGPEPEDPDPPAEVSATLPELTQVS